jgi:hypothetical protein
MTRNGSGVDPQGAFRLFLVSISIVGASAFVFAVPWICSQCSIRVGNSYEIVALAAAVAFCAGAFANICASIFGVVKCIEAKVLLPWPIAGITLWCGFTIAFLCVLFHVRA